MWMDIDRKLMESLRKIAGRCVENWCHFMENEWAMDGTLMDNGWMVHSWKIKYRPLTEHC